MSRVLLFTENLGSGGAERQLTRLAVLLKQAGHVVKVITYVENQFREEYLHDNDIDYQLNKRIYGHIAGLWYLYKSIKDYNPDNIISFLPSPNIRMCISRLFIKTNLIISERSHTINWGLREKMVYNIYRLADVVVVNSYSETKNIQGKCPFLGKKLKTIVNSVDSQRYHPHYEEKKIDKVCLIGVGRCIPSKNVLGAIEAISILKKQGVSVNFKWVGAHYEKVYVEECANLIKELGLEDSVFLQDQTEDMVAEYNKADALIMPTFYEGFPNVICEAMSCSLPVVCSNVYDNPFIVKDGVNGFLFDPMKPQDIADAIKRLLSLPPHDLERMKKYNREVCIKDYSEDLLLKKYIALFK